MDAVLMITIPVPARNETPAAQSLYYFID